MGLGMAMRLLGAGHDLRVYNRTASKAAELERAGAKLCRTPREACTDAAAVFAMTARLAPRAFAIECSTLSYNWVMELATEARARGLRYIDAPVTGLPDAAAAGELTLLVGADTNDLESARPILSAVSNRILHFGAVGSGTAYKLIINLMGAVQIAALAEGMALAERIGLDLDTVANAISTGQAVRNARRIVADDHDRNVVFTPILRLKDVEYALQLAQGIGMRAPFGQIAAGQLQQLIALGYSRDNESRIIEVARLL
jgi:3-hydroxyisobutyrate dehydrogenase